MTPPSAATASAPAASPAPVASAAPNRVRCKVTAEPTVLATLPQVPPQTRGWVPEAPALFLVPEEGILVVSTVPQGGGGTLSAVAIDGSGAQTLTTVPTGYEPSGFAYRDGRLWFTHANRLHTVALSGAKTDEVAIEDFGEHLYVHDKWAYAVHFDAKTRTASVVRADLGTRAVETVYTRDKRSSVVDAFMAVVADAAHVYVLDSGAREVVAVDLTTRESKMLYQDKLYLAYASLLFPNGDELLTDGVIRVPKSGGTARAFGCKTDETEPHQSCFGFVFAADDKVLLSMKQAPYTAGKVGNSVLVTAMPREGGVTPRDVLDVPTGARGLSLDADCLYVAQAVDDRQPTRVLAYTRPKSL